MLPKIVFILIGISGYISIMLAFYYGFKRAQKVHNITLSHVKKEVPHGILLRGIFSIIYYFCIIDWIFGINIITWSYLPLPLLINWLGAFLLILVTLFFWWINITLDSNYNSALYIHENHQLIMSGPYSLIRHPTYLAFPMFHISLFLMTSNWLILISGLFMSIWINHYRIKYEEKLLIEKFSEDYVEYIKTTGKYFPQFVFKKRQ